MMLVLLGLGFGFVHRVVNTAEIPGAIVSLSDPQTVRDKKNELSRQERSKSDRCDDGSIFDVMLIYTPPARAAAAATRAMNVLIIVRRYTILV